MFALSLLNDMTFQETVGGLAPQNLCFAEASLAMRRCSFREVIFKGDLNAFRDFPDRTICDTMIPNFRGHCMATRFVFYSWNRTQICVVIRGPFRNVMQSQSQLSPIEKWRNSNPTFAKRQVRALFNWAFFRNILSGNLLPT